MDEQLIEALLPYLGHLGNCDFLQPMWHKGPCDCGWADLEAKLPPGLYEKVMARRQEINREMYRRAEAQSTTTPAQQRNGQANGE